jgi:hypothetical protein
MSPWRPVIGYGTKYWVSVQGEVWSNPSRRLMKQTVAFIGRSKIPYFVVNLTGEHSRQRVHPVHLLVLEAFRGPPLEGMEGCHGDKGTLVNSLTNLSWGTHSKNNGEDKVRDHTTSRGEKNGQAKLTWEQACEIRSRYVPRVVTMQFLADEYDISIGHAFRIIKNKRWEHDPSEW